MFPWGTFTRDDIVKHALFNYGGCFRYNQTGMEESDLRSTRETPHPPLLSSPELVLSVCFKVTDNPVAFSMNPSYQLELQRYRFVFAVFCLPDFLNMDMLGTLGVGLF